MAAGNEDFRRKVRAPQGRVVANSDRGRPQGKCNRKHTAPRALLGFWGKGEKARQELTSPDGDIGSLANPTRCKTK